MKTTFNNIIMMATAITMAVAFAACSKNNETPEPEEPEPGTEKTTPIRVDQSACSFTSGAVGTYNISVSGTTDWEVRNEAAWVITEKQSDNTLRVMVTPSRNPQERIATLTIVAANEAQGAASFTVKQDPGKPVVSIRLLPGYIPLRHCSENGLWVTGQKSDIVRVLSVEEMLKDESYLGTQVTMNGGVHSIDNNGKPYSDGCTADGTIYTGYDQSGAKDDGGEEWWPNHYTPYIMRNNRKIELNYPKDYHTSNIEEEGYATRHYYQGCIPDKMSADGKFIYGRLMNVNNGWFACKWTRIGTTNEYTFKELGLNSDGDLNKWEKSFVDFEGKTYMNYVPESFLCPQNISGLSPYGKYACGHYGSDLGGGGQLFRYDMEADKLELLNANGIALYITDDGTLFDASNRVWKLGANTSITLREWLVETYGEKIVGQIVSGFAMGSVSPDNTTTLLFAIDSQTGVTTNYIITVVP
jgi:hypothetical protein